MADINPNLSATTLTANDVNTPVKRQIGRVNFKKTTT